MQPAQVTLILRIKRVIANTHDVEIASADFDRQITKALPRRDEGAACLRFIVACAMSGIGCTGAHHGLPTGFQLAGNS